MRLGVRQMQRNLQSIGEFLGCNEDFPSGDLRADSRQVLPSDVFVAAKGQLQDGRSYIDAALKNGASAVIYEAADGFSFNQSGIKSYGIKNLNAILPQLSSRYYGEPSKQIGLFGVTGTNGKSSTTYYVAQLLEAVSMHCGIIGTVGNGFFGDLRPAVNTTPGPVEIQQELVRQIEAGARYVAMEVSSHGIAQGRIDGLTFKRTAFTNLSRDHLDFHKTMEAYFEVKKSFILRDPDCISVLNSDDEWIKTGLLNGSVSGNFLTAGRGGGFGFDRLKAHGAGTSFVLRENENCWDINLPLIGAFNVSNALMAYALVRSLGFEGAPLREALANLKPLKGRMELFSIKDSPLCIVDYAHTPDGLQKALSGARQHTSGRLVCVAGCGGDRDRGKRPMMAEIATRQSDLVIFTDDNPRTEDPDQIMADMLKGVFNNHYEVIHDRREAITRAISLCGSEDAVLIAGKGHEDYQIVGTTKRHFSDQEVVREVLDI